MRIPPTLRRAATEWLAKGYAVEIVLDPPTIRVTPQAREQDQFDMVEMGK